MNIHEVAGKLIGSGEHILGADATGSHACYLIYGVLKAGEKGRVLKPGAGHEEMVLAVNGDIILHGRSMFVLGKGQAAHLVGEETFLAENPGSSDVIYVVAGGHGAGGHAH
ncbi:MAG: hypothetical protein OEW15_10045 [Nitrospirota bacterium]|nr:hypothetical protein [Nitrospirota bacterium]